MIRRFILLLLAFLILASFGSAYRPALVVAEPPIAEPPIAEPPVEKPVVALDKSYTIEFPIEVVVHAPMSYVQIHSGEDCVDWHASFEDACTASRKSGKRVLLFQLLGTYGDEFC